MAELRFHHISLTFRDPIVTERFYTQHFGFTRARVVPWARTTGSSFCAATAPTWSCSAPRSRTR